MNHCFAIIGCGRIAQRHALQISKVGKLVAVCDIMIEKAQSLATEYGANPYGSIDDLLENEPNITIVSICTPNGLHAEHSIKCLQSSKHVLCEKPLAINLKDAAKMMQTAAEHNRKLFVVKQNRYNPPVEAVKNLLRENKLGSITSFQINCFWNRNEEYYLNSWKGTKLLDGGTLYTQFSHFIDLLYWFLGDVKSVKSILKNSQHPNIEIEDCGMVVFEMNQGAIGTMNYNVNAYQKNMEGSFAIFGTNGTIKIGGQYLNTLEYQSIADTSLRITDAGNKANDYGFYQGTMSNHDKVYEHLIRAIDDNGYEFAGAQDGYKTVEIIEMIYQSANF